MEIRRLAKQDIALLGNVSADVFDNSINSEFTREFLTDPRHHIVVAIVETEVVGFASGVHYIHPDKPTELFINEVGVAKAYQRKGVATRLLEELLALGKELECVEAWVLTEFGNAPARALYESVGGQEDPNPPVLYSFRI